MLFSYQNKREWVVDVFACGTDMVINCAWPLVVSSKSQMCEFDDGVRFVVDRERLCVVPR